MPKNKTSNTGPASLKPPPYPDIDLPGWVEHIYDTFVKDAPTPQEGDRRRLAIQCTNHLVRELRAIRRVLEGKQ